MSGVAIVSTSILAAAAFVAALKILWPALQTSASWLVRWNTASKVTLYELQTNQGASVKDKVQEALVISRENQRALEQHLVAHGWDQPDEISGVPF